MNLEDRLHWHIQLVELPEPEREYRFCERRWRFDFCWPELMIAAEVEGGTWTNRSRHTRGKGFENDCVKYNRATLDGWRVFRFTSTMVRDGRALDTLEKAIRGEGE